MQGKDVKYLVRSEQTINPVTLGLLLSVTLDKKSPCYTLI